MNSSFESDCDNVYKNELETDKPLCRDDIIKIKSSSQSISLDENKDNLGLAENTDDNKENPGPYKYSSNRYKNIDKFRGTNDLLLMINSEDIPKKIAAVHKKESLNSTARNSKVVSKNIQESRESEDLSSMSECSEDRDESIEFEGILDNIVYSQCQENFTDEEIKEILEEIQEIYDGR